MNKTVNGTIFLRNSICEICNTTEQTIKTNWTSFVCNDTSGHCGESNKQDPNLVFALASVFLLCTALFFGTAFNFAAIHKLITHNWRKNLTFIQLFILGFIVCGLLVPIQIIRISLTFQESHFKFMELCYVHHFIHIHVESCTSVTTLIIAFEKLFTIHPYCKDKCLTYKKTAVTFTWILAFPFAIYFIYQERENAVFISIFSYDCEPGIRHKIQGHLVESISSYIFIVTMVTLSLIYFLFIWIQWGKMKKRITKINQAPCSISENPISEETQSSNTGILQPQLEDSNTQPGATTHRRTMVPPIIVPSQRKHQNKEKLQKLHELNIKVHGLKECINKIDVRDRTEHQDINIYDLDNYLKGMAEDMTGHTDIHAQFQNDPKSKEKENPNKTIPDMVEDQTILGLAENQTNHCVVERTNIQQGACISLESFVSQKVSSDLSNANISADLEITPRKDEVIKTKEEPNNSSFLKLDEDKTDNIQALEITKRREPSISNSEGKSSIVTSSISEVDNENSMKLNPLRHTRICPGNVWQPESNISISSYRPSLMKKPKSVKKRRKLKKQESMESLGTISVSSQQSDRSYCTDSNGELEIPPCSFRGRKSIDSFLDEGLTNILEQPESETTYQDNKSIENRQGTSQDQFDNLEIPDQMRLRSNTGDIHLKVDQDEFRQRAQSDLTEDKQKKLLEKKKFQSLLNRKTRKGSSSRIFPSDTNLKSLQGSLHSISTDSSYSDICFDHMKTPIRLITHNNLSSSMDSIDQLSIDNSRTDISTSKCNLFYPATENTHTGMKNKKIDSSTQTEEEIVIINDTGFNSRSQQEYPIIQIIRPSIDSTVSQLRSPVRIVTRNFPAIYEDMEENKVSHLNVPTNVNTSHENLPATRQTDGNVKTKNYIIRTGKKSMLIILTFALAFLPMCITVHFLERIPNGLELQVLTAVRCVQYLYYAFLTKIYL